MKLLLARLPDRLDADDPLIIEEMTALNRAGNTEAVSTMIAMLSDLHEHGRTSRFLRTMKGTPIKELKARARSGVKGGSRVYLFITEHDEAAIVNCEVKDGKAPDPEKLKVVLRVVAAYKRGVPVLAAGG